MPWHRRIINFSTSTTNNSIQEQIEIMIQDVPSTKDSSSQEEMPKMLIKDICYTLY